MKKIIFGLAFLNLSLAMAQTDTITSKIPFDGMDLTWINGQNRQKKLKKSICKFIRLTRRPFKLM